MILTASVARMSEAISGADLAALRPLRPAGLEHRWRIVYICKMNITLSPAQKKWLEAQIDAGHFSSVDDAVAVAVAELMAINYDDLAWAKPYVEEIGRASCRERV